MRAEITMNKRVKYGLSVFAVFAALICGSIPAQAAKLPTKLFLNDTQYMVTDKSAKVYDYANLLSDDEEEKLRKLSKEMSGKYDADFIIVTIDDNPAPGTNGLDPVLEFGGLFFDENYFGTQKGNMGYNEGNGSTFVIDMQHRGNAVSTTGFVQDSMSQRDTDKIIDATLDDLGDGDYYDACKYYLDYTDEVLFYDYQYDSLSFFGKIVYQAGKVSPFIPIGSGLFIAVFVLVILLSRQQTSKHAYEAGRYVVPGSLKIRDSRETFVNTFTTVETIEDTSSSGSGGGHTTGGGGSHGGSSGRF